MIRPMNAVSSYTQVYMSGNNFGGIGQMLLAARVLHMFALI